MRPALFLLVLVLVSACGSGTGDHARRLRLATTTSTRDSGLLDDLLADFYKLHPMEVQVIAVGTGQALALGARGDADIVLVHARSREDAFMAAGHGLLRRDVMWNDFVILGPPADPAGIRGTTDALEALRRIRASGARFVSRGDDSGTHIRERALWKLAGGPPTGADAYLDAGQGMGRCLVIADEKGAYILADRGTYLSFRKRIDLEVSCAGDVRLRNPYGAMIVDPDKHPDVNAAGARLFLDYLTSSRGRSRIASYRMDGKALFHPHAPG